jgi:hypothetical protein
LQYLSWLIRLNGKYSLEAFRTDGFESLIYFCVEFYSQRGENLGEKAPENLEVRECFYGSRKKSSGPLQGKIRLKLCPPEASFIKATFKLEPGFVLFRVPLQ